MSDFIPGIFNYCDRWCERCAFTSRCRVYSMQQARGSCGSNDIRNAAFWQQLRQTFQETLGLIRQSAREHGIDLDAAMPEPVEARLRLPSEEYRKLLRQARAYVKFVDAWFKDNRTHLENKEADLEPPPMPRSRASIRRARPMTFPTRWM